MRLDVNLATRPFVNRMPQMIILGVLGLAAGLFTTWNVLSVLGSRAAQRAVESQLHELAAEEADLVARREIAEGRLAKADLAPLRVRADAANTVLAQKAVSWTLLLERLEELLPWQAALRKVGTSIGPGGVKLDLTVRAKTYEDALALIDSLERSPCFSNVYPRTDIDPKAAQEDIEMSLEADHDPYCGAAGAPNLSPKGAGRSRG